MAWQGTHRFARISARKARLVVDMIRGLEVTDAMNVLKFSPNRAASMLSKALQSAVANADNAEADVENLFIERAFVNEGPTIKRFHPKDRGRAHPIRKRTSHITVVVEEAEE